MQFSTYSDYAVVGPNVYSEIMFYGSRNKVDADKIHIL